MAKIYDKKIQITKSEQVQIDRSLNHRKFQAATAYQAKDWPSLIESMKLFHSTD
jgi:hypothetical protein